jgi:hypothetical protein
MNYALTYLDKGRNITSISLGFKKKSSFFVKTLTLVKVIRRS